jgi:threonine-phosphate decarboxylase
MSHSYDHGGNIFVVARTLGVGIDQLIDFSASINPLGMSSLVRQALVNSFDSLNHYPDTSHKELKQALAKYHALSSSNFAIANGSTELIYNLPAMLPGKKALIISPSFSEYNRALGQHQWETEYFILTPESNFLIDMEMLERKLENGFDALFVCNPGNPSGAIYPQVMIEKICNLCLCTGTFLVLDEAFMDFSEETSAKRMIINSDNAILLRSMTKFFGIPGLRLGYAICNEALTERLEAMGGPWSVNTLALNAGVAALQDITHNKKSLALIKHERSSLLNSLAMFPQFMLYPSAANYLLVEIKSGMTSYELKEHLLQQRILIRDCTSFIGLTNRFFRIAVRTKSENTRLLRCLDNILNSKIMVS